MNKAQSKLFYQREGKMCIRDSNYARQKVQPKIQALKDRFPDDPTRQSQEMQKIYAEMKFNPLAGCLPMLLQMPIFIALFQVCLLYTSRCV